MAKAFVTRKKFRNTRKDDKSFLFKRDDRSEDPREVITAISLPIEGIGSVVQVTKIRLATDDVSLMLAIVNSSAKITNITNLKSIVDLNIKDLRVNQGDPV